MRNDHRITWIKALLIATTFCFPSFGQVIISEFMASNSHTLADEDGDYSDWIELLNPGSANVNLNGWTLTDSAANPRRWKFPAINIDPGQSMVIFASGKDRRVPGSPLHTDFKLSGKGGFLALADAAGQVVFSYGTNYPSQLPDISFGVVVEEQSVILSETNSPVRYFVPQDGSLEENWKAAEFDDSGWKAGLNSFGFDQNSAFTNTWRDLVLAADPLLYFPFEEASGTNTANLGSLGSAQNATLFSGTLLNQAGLRPSDANGMSPTNLAARFDGRDDYISTSKSSLSDLSAFTMAGWIRPASLTKTRVGLWGQHDAIEFGFIDAKLLQLSTAGGGNVQADYPFAANEWHFVAVTGDGENLRIYLDGVVVAEGGNITGNYGSSLYPFVIGGGGIFDASQNWFTGNIDEFAFYPRALSGDELFSQFQTALDPSANYRSAIATDLSSDMAGVNASVYIRSTFVTGENADYDRLVLRVQCDDGFLASLNGVAVAEENAPPDAAWNSAAKQDRPGAIGLRWREFDLSANRGLLQAGTNLLTVQTLNSAANDSDLFFQSELIGIRRSVQTNAFRYFLQPTPGELNGTGDTNIGPLIVDISHSPQNPSDADSIAVLARMVPTINPPAGLTLTYRVMFGVETTVTMQDDGQNGDGVAGDGIYGAVIPVSAAAGQMVRWYLRASDTQGNSTRWPLYRDTKNSPQYLGTVIANPALTNPLPVLHWYIQNTAGADSTSGTRSSVFWNGILYDNIFVNVHGQSSLGFPKKSYNFDFNTGYHFAYSESGSPVEDINLLTTYPDKAHIRNILSYETYRDSGHPYHFVIPVRVQRNGAFFSDAHIVEDGDSDYLARVGLSPRGALYKMYNSLDSSSTGVEKKTRKFENNTDLQKLIAGLSLTGDARTAFVYDNVDIPGMVNYLATMIVTGNVDCCAKNYYLYRDSEGNGEWQFLPWDVDLSFGRNWTSAKTYFDDTMYYSNGLYVGGGNKLPAVLFGMPAIKQMYLRRLRTLIDELLQSAATPAPELRYEKRIRELYAQIGPDAALDFAKWATWGTPQTMPQALGILTNDYMPKRRNFLYAQRDIPTAITNDITLNFGSFDFNPSSGLQSHEYLTIFNPNNYAVDISGWTLEGGVQHHFASGTVLPASGTLYVSPDVNAFRQRLIAPKGGQGLFVQGNYQGQLSARGDLVILRDRGGRVVNSMNYTGQPTDAQQFLRVTEIMYAPPDSSGSGLPREELEYLVLKNTGPAPLDISGSHFENGITFAFDAETVLAPGQSIYIAKNPTLFSIYYGTNFWVAGPYLGQLSNEGERLELYDGVGEKVLDFSYSNQWYPLTDSQGYSLVIQNENASYTSWADKIAWTVSPLIGGSAAINIAWNNYQTFYFSESELADANVSGMLADADDDGLSNYDEFLVGTNPRDAQSNLGFSLLSLEQGKFAVRFFSVSGRAYSVWSADDLSTEWLPANSTTRVTESGIIQLEVSPPPGKRSQYFKLRVSL